MENNNDNNKNKKTLILSILGILVLIIAVVGVSFAMYKFTGTGTQTNVIKTGTVNMSFDDGNSTIELSNEYPMTDEYAIKNNENNKKNFTVTANWGGTSPMAIAYSLGIDEDMTEGETLTKEHIKIALLDSEGNILVGTPKLPSEEPQELAGGTLISALQDQSDDLTSSYMLAHKVITDSNTSDTYTLYAWVDENYDLPYDKTDGHETGEVVTDSEGKTKTEKTTKIETFKFKITVKAKQLLDEDEYSNYQ